MHDLAVAHLAGADLLHRQAASRPAGRSGARGDTEPVAGDDLIADDAAVDGLDALCPPAPPFSRIASSLLTLPSAPPRC